MVHWEYLIMRNRLRMMLNFAEGRVNYFRGVPDTEESRGVFRRVLKDFLYFSEELYRLDREWGTDIKPLYNY